MFKVLLFLNQVSWTYSGQVKSNLQTSNRKCLRIFQFQLKLGFNIPHNQALIFCLATAFNAFIKLPYTREKVKQFN